MELVPPPTPTFPVFTVHRHEPELVVPAGPTPRECKLLSDIDDQEGLRYQMPGFHLYRRNSSMEGKDPTKVIREALARALVFYYPFAGRLREAPNGKLMVDCNSEGVVFVEADADIAFEDLGGAICPPFPCFEELLLLLHDVPAGELCQNPIEYAVDLVKEAKAMVTEEFMKSMIDLLAIRDGPKLCPLSLLISDLRRAGLGDVIFGWGNAAQMAPAQVFEVMNFYIPYKNNKGEDGILVPLCLEASVMELLVKEMDSLLNLKDEAISSS